MSLETFHQLPSPEAAALVRPCADVDSWVTAVVAGRPYASIEAAILAADVAAQHWTPADVTQALAHHPRIGERATGGSTEASLSRNEQAGLATDADVEAALLAGNRDYEARFNQVFLIRAAGRTAPEILAELRRRLTNTDDTEALEVADQLRQIALLRLKGVLAA